jgi:nucleoside-diphosphate-sugar epimerase
VSEQPKKQRILVTGSSGLIGSQLIPVLQTMGFETVGMDIRVSNDLDYGDICHGPDLMKKVEGCTGVIHLAAISRVAVAHRNPELCMKTNFEASRNLATLAKHAGAKWFVYASSREVYGHVKSTPVTEYDGLKPVNVYGDAKLRSERYIEGLADESFNPSIIRFSNVFGVPNDHETRVIPAFIKAAYHGDDLNVEGGDNAFDFTFVDEVVRAVGLLVEQLQQGQKFKPMHFTTGHETSLNELAAAVISLFQSQSCIVPKTPRDFDVSKFSGDASLAFKQLGWRHEAQPLAYFLRKYAERLGYLSTEKTMDNVIQLPRQDRETSNQAFEVRASY